MYLETVSEFLRKARSVNQSSGSFVSKVPTTTEPTGDAGNATGTSIIELVPPGTQGGGGCVQNLVRIMPYGTGSATNTFSMRIIGWSKLPSSSPPQKPDLWVPVVLAELLCTLSSVTGVAGSDVDNTQLFAGTIAIVGTSGNPGVSLDIVSPANSVIAHVVADMKGFQKLELSFSTGSSATDCNALVAKY